MILNSEFALQDHKAMYHNPNRKPIKCEKCDYSSLSKDRVKAHFKRVHIGLPKHFVCDICGNRFNLNGNLKHHIKTVHEGQKYVRKKARTKMLDRKLPVSTKTSEDYSA